MKERPILFSAPMVRAILEGRKTQTRRVVKPQPEVLGWQDIQAMHGRSPDGMPFGDPYKWRVVGPDYPDYPDSAEDDVRSPYAIGDRLWVRETWSDANSDGPCVLYRADHDRRYLVDESYPIDYARYPGANFAQWAADVESGAEGRWRPSIHMPRWASRITLEVTGVRVERLTDIREADCWAEGIERSPESPGKASSIFSDYASPRVAFMHLWKGINGEASWDSNPWVWVVELKRVQP